MIITDVNLLVYAYSSKSSFHTEARAWWEDLLNHQEPVAVPWVCVLGFIRLVTHAKVLEMPMTPEAAITHVQSWFERPNVERLEPGPRHLEFLSKMVSAAGTAGNLTTDVHLAALAVEHQCELHSNDADFARFPGLKWTNPLQR